MGCAQVFGVFLALLSAAVTPLLHQCVAAPAHFWLSADAVAPAGPNVPTNISIVQGTVGSLAIWGRPETDKKLRNVSLNLVALSAGVDFVDSSITVYNDAGGGKQRYEYTSDASSSPALESEESLFEVQINGQADSIELLQGYSLSSSAANIKGVGDQCVGAETGCVIAGDGLPAWLIATVDYNAIVGGPVTEVHLQIGEHGINHESLVSGDYDLNGVVDNDDFNEVQTNFSSTVNLWLDGSGNGRVDVADFTIWRDNLGSVSAFEVASLSSVRFGADTIDGVDEPIYDAGTDRDVTLAMDDPDATITIVPLPPIQAAPIQAAPVSVPEPTSICLLLFSVAGPGGFRLRASSLRR